MHPNLVRMQPLPKQSAQYFHHLWLYELGESAQTQTWVKMWLCRIFGPTPTPCSVLGLGAVPLRLVLWSDGNATFGVQKPRSGYHYPVFHRGTRLRPAGTVTVCTARPILLIQLLALILLIGPPSRNS